MQTPGALMGWQLPGFRTNESGTQSFYDICEAEP